MGKDRYAGMDGKSAAAGGWGMEDARDDLPYALAQVIGNLLSKYDAERIIAIIGSSRAVQEFTLRQTTQEDIDHANAIAKEYGWPIRFVPEKKEEPVSPSAVEKTVADTRGEWKQRGLLFDVEKYRRPRKPR